MRTFRFEITDLNGNHLKYIAVKAYNIVPARSQVAHIWLEDHPNLNINIKTLN